MKDQRPYLLRALYDWILDSDTTPYLLVAVNSPEVVVPEEHVSEGRIILNISPQAVRSLTIEENLLEFDGRFAGRQFWVSVPISSIAAIYARETGQGMAFDVTESEEPSASTESEDDRAATGDGKRQGPTLKVIK